MLDNDQRYTKVWAFVKDARPQYKEVLVRKEAIIERAFDLLKEHLAEQIRESCADPYDD